MKRKIIKFFTMPITVAAMLISMASTVVYAANNDVTESKTWPQNPRVTFDNDDNIESVDYDTITFGEYNNNPIVWRVLSVDDDIAFLFADDILPGEYQKFYYTHGEATWKQSTIRSWLNSTEGNYTGDGFLNTAFTADEKAAIVESEIDNIEEVFNQDKYESLNDPSKDYVFLLSIEELGNTAYGFSEDIIVIDGQRAASESYWTRSKPSTSNISTIVVSTAGIISTLSGVVYNTDSWTAVRPALKVDLTKLGFEKPIKNVEYNMITEAGDNKLSWTKGSGSDLTFTIKAVEDPDDSYEHFSYLSIDNKTLTRDKDYTATKGSTIISVKAASLEALSAGEHKISVVFDNGTLEMSLNIEDAQSQAVTTPTTGDNGIIPWLVLTLAAAGISLPLLRIRKLKGEC